MDFHVSVYDGSYHDVDSSEVAFKIAGSMAFKAAIAKADPVLLEPIMKVDVTVPEEYMGDVIGDLNSRRGRIEGMDHNGTTEEIHALVPLSEMFGYSTALRSRTQGRGVTPCSRSTVSRFRSPFRRRFAAPRRRSSLPLPARGREAISRL